MSKRKLADVEATVVFETDDAVKLRSSQTNEIGWVPKSICEFDPEDFENGDTVTATMPVDFAEQKGFV